MALTMKKIIPILATLLLFNKSIACLNGESMVLKDGTYLYFDREGGVPYGHIFNDEGFKSGIRQLDSLYNQTKDLDYLSDKGLLLILMKRYNEAIKLYLEIEKIMPNRYSTASNIGTAYELLGQNKKALEWIKKSVQIDPKSHKNSEWIHVKILEAKIHGDQFISTNFLLNTDFGSDSIPKTTLKQNELIKLSDALYYQLNERVSFVKPKDKIVAQLFFDLGTVAFLLENYKDASSDYEEAKRYGFTEQLLEKRLTETKRLSMMPKLQSKIKLAIDNNSKSRPNAFNFKYGLWGFGFLLLVIRVIIIYKFRKKKHNPLN